MRREESPRVKGKVETLSEKEKQYDRLGKSRS